MTRTVPKSEMSPEMIQQMRPIWVAAYEALRTDLGTLEDLARAAARAAAARDAAPTPEQLAARAAEYQRQYRAKQAAKKLGVGGSA